MRFLRLASVRAAGAVAAFVFNIGSSDADAQAGRAGGPNTPTGPTIGWTTYGANLTSHRYSPADTRFPDRSADARNTRDTAHGY